MLKTVKNGSGIGVDPPPPVFLKFPHFPVFFFRERPLSRNIYLCWEEIGISLKIDKDIIRMMKDVKTRFDKGRGKMTAVKKNELVTNLKETTLNIAASNWKSKVNQDCSLNAAWRQEKIAFVEDYIVREATR